MARRGWREGSICQRTVTRNGKEYHYWRAALPRGADGRRREHEARTERAARKWLKDESGDRRVSGGDGVTLGTYAVGWLRDTSLTVKPSTTDFYRAALRHLDDVATLPLTALTSAHVRELIGVKVEAGLASRTVRGIIQTLSLVLRRAEEDGLVERNVARVKLPKLETKEARHFTAAQARRFLEVAKDDALGSLYAVALGTGLRRGELLALTWREVDRDHHAIRVRRSKTASGVREVPVPEFAWCALEDDPRSPGPIWDASPTYVTRHFQALCRQAGVPVLTFHEIRHTAATLMAEAGVSIEVRRWLLGHSKTEMTARYSHESEVLMRDAVERLGRMVG